MIYFFIYFLYKQVITTLKNDLETLVVTIYFLHSH